MGVGEPRDELIGNGKWKKKLKIVNRKKRACSNKIKMSY